MVLFVILLGLLNESSDTVLLKPRVPLWRTSRGSTGIWGLIWVFIFVWGLPTTWGVVFLFWTGSFVVLCPDTLGDTVTPPLLLVLVDRFMAAISVKAVILSMNLSPVFRNGFAASDGFFKASVNSYISDEAVSGMVYFSGRNTTVSDTLVALVLGI
jgi:hypothetical protein